jgi:hypothetical protein
MAMPSETLLKIQDQIQDLEDAYHAETTKLVVERDLKKNAVFQERTELLRAKGATQDFWRAVLRSHPDIQGELLGPYDDLILDALEDFHVTYLADGGFRIAATFRDNDFFTDKQLSLTVSAPDENMDHDITASGVNWKEGHGPLNDDEMEEANNRQAGSKTTREEAAATRGQSMFEVFDSMPPHPDDDEEEEDEEDGPDEEEREEMAQAWEEMHKERMEIVHCLVEEVWEEPLAILIGASLQDSDDK